MKVSGISSAAFAKATEEERVLPHTSILCQIIQIRVSSSRLYSLILISVFSFFFSQNIFGQINIQESIKIGGIQQWIQIKGARSENPILLFLHGGPGNSAISYARKFTAELQKNFVVVQWDQRECGKTLKLNPPNQPLSLGVVESDVLEMINYLLACALFKTENILNGPLMGWFLGIASSRSSPGIVRCLPCR